MKKKGNWLVMVLVFGILVGCASTGKAPNSFVLGQATPVTIQLRRGLDFNQAFREVSFILLQNNFQTETLQPEAGFIRTNWRLWVTPRGETFEGYVCHFQSITNTSNSKRTWSIAR
jgi:hypothetical protein